MGKNQAHQARKSSFAASAGDGDDGSKDFSDGLKDVSFHTAEWHAARISALQVERPTYDQWLKKRKEEEGKLSAIADEEEKKMREYRAQLDAERTERLRRGTNHAAEKKEKKEKKSKKKKNKEKSKKRKKEDDKKKKKSSSKKRHRKHDSSSSSSDSSSGESSDEDSSSEEDERSKKKKRSPSPIRLSEFLKG
ncbi:hypothetical protein CEUSTIGMA_g852.t1 [Chlamydomonas eustigma]|uniref:CBF1-interacting co-repressor CIR N-terminal domain-containing protein n=1 Tax=Chlamydomonas eustigma TaxID=1157962 RepID=A0A250WRS2_9CHLO|nr:hypothetical protein CEUSTIGMA_g852.t1 [Chlamydomonas eustigma]|eukprot:GAX73399.1 hypothetical protein CEUSTIGMA_g852.t1 [Chlamydomonas eustigma]